MKIGSLIITTVFGIACFGGCGFHKVTESEARKRAEAEFEHICTIPYGGTPQNKLYYKTNEFVGPQLRIGRGETTDELSYEYVWKHKSTDYEIVVAVTESGGLAGGGGPTDYKDSLEPPPKKTDKRN